MDCESHGLLAERNHSSATVLATTSEKSKKFDFPGKKTDLLILSQ